MKFLCCGKGDQNDGADQPSRPTRMPDKPPQVPPVVVADSKASTAAPSIPAPVDDAPLAQEKPTISPPNEDASIAQEKSASSEKPDLWKEAFDGLNEEQKKLVTQGQSQAGSTTDAINGVIDHTKEKYTEWQKSGLKVKRKNGEDIDVRAVTEKVLNAALQAQSLIANIAAFDPTGKGKLFHQSLCY